MSITTVSPTNNSSSELQNAINRAQPGDTILALPGTYGPGASTGDQSMMVLVNTKGLLVKSAVAGGAILDAAMRCHSPIALGANSAGFILDGFRLTRGLHAGFWSNSGGGQSVLIRNCEFCEIARRTDSTTLGNAGIYTDATADIRIENNRFWNIGRTNQAANSFDHSIYTHGRCRIRRNAFLNSVAGWHIQTSKGFSGEISGNTFTGPNMYPDKSGQIMLWDQCGSLVIRGNVFSGSRNTALTEYAFMSPSLVIEGNTVHGGSLGAPTGSITRGNRVIAL